MATKKRAKKATKSKGGKKAAANKRRMAKPAAKRSVKRKAPKAKARPRIAARAPKLLKSSSAADKKRSAQFRLAARRLDDEGNVVIPGANESPRAPRGMLAGLGAGSGGQSGDIQGLRAAEVADAESVTELAEDGQAYEAEVVDGVENAPDADQGEVKTHERPEDDAREEYDEDNR